MAINTDRPLDYNLNTESDPLAELEPSGIDVEIEVAELETTPDGVVINGEEVEVDRMDVVGHYDNLVAFIDNTEASRIAQDIIDKVHDSAEARSGWLKMYNSGYRDWETGSIS